MESQPIWAASYGPGVPLHIDYGDDTLVDQFERTACRFPDRTAVDFLGATMTYAQLARDVHRVAAGLLSLGVKAGDRVAVLLPTCPQNLIATEAILRIGAIAVQHNPLYTAEELVGPMRDHGARVVIAWDKIAQMVLGLQDDTSVEHVISVDMTHALPRSKRLALKLPVKKARETRDKLTIRQAPGTTPWSHLLTCGEVPVWHERPTKDDVAIMLYTSGTSGTPKGVPLTHANMAAMSIQGKAWTNLRDGNETFIVVLPMFHAYGLTVSVLEGVLAGACLTMLPAPEIPLIMQAIKRRKPTFVPGVPPLYARMLDAAAKRKISLQGIRMGLSGAMSLPPALVERWEKATGGHLIEGYGLTETSPVVVGNPISDARRAGSIGVPFPDVEIRLADVDDVTKDAPAGGPGELLVKGPQVFAGYYNRPEETEKAFHDGFFRTGDVVTQDEDGYLTVVDRIKELIVTGGFNVYPSEVEGILRTHDSIDDVAVVGLPHPDGGEEVVAAVVLADGHTEANRDELRTHTKRHLTAYKAPRRFFVVSELPLNPMGKVLRREVVRVVGQLHGDQSANQHGTADERRGSDKS